MSHGQASFRKSEKKYIQNRLEQGLCARCGKKKSEEREKLYDCKECSDKRKQYMREWLIKRKVKVNKVEK